MHDTTLKQKVIDSIEKLPEDASLDEIMERIYFIHKIEVGLKQSEQGDVISHDEVFKKIDRW
ncbi:hypothetical protein [Rhodohalobacter sp. 8-1]|uniref:hypothetical protein n=1 Tax=Rhodohalobacter sp. 8-1 TaxID=3131972 RepID=UPI0030EDEF26